ncbi:MAG: hypothetical protein IPP94_12080 [Ignavibacteria bacterium]|nr:hypothetical protein [Ignavibacteria bacterium]
MFNPSGDCAVPVVGYFADRWPEKSSVLAVEKSHVTVHSNNRLLLLTQASPESPFPRLVSAGAFVNFTGTNGDQVRLKDMLERLLSFAGHRLYEHEPSTGIWIRDATAAREVPFSAVPLPLLDAMTHRVDGDPDHASPLLTCDDFQSEVPRSRRGIAEELFCGTSGPPEHGSGLRIENRTASSDFFDLAGSRVLLMGRERGGIDELWFHPIRGIRNYHAGILLHGAIHWLDEYPCSITVRPEGFERLYDTPAGLVRERLTVSPEHPTACAEYSSSSADSLRVFLRFESDFRLMWPFDAGALREMQFFRHAPSATVHVRNRPHAKWKTDRFVSPRPDYWEPPMGSDYALLFSADRRAERSVCGMFGAMSWRNDGIITEPDTANVVSYGGVYTLRQGGHDTLRVTVTAGETDMLSGWLALPPILEPSRMVDEAAAHARRLLETSLVIDSPDSAFNALTRWALVGTERFRTRTYDDGPALTAGIGTTARGWDGGHRVSGRPGYAWWFGRDAAWASLAVSGYGDFPLVQAQLRFFSRHQDPFSGKILHELSTSDVVHYDAADATPLYIILAAQYLRASRDSATIRDLWPSIVRAYEFMQSTDTDGDGLIENTDVGHGWVEGGALAGMHTEFYLAGLQARALRDMQTICNAMRTRRNADARKAEAVLQDVNKELSHPAIAKLFHSFWNDSTKYFRHGLRKDGGWHDEPTVLATVPVLLLADDPLFTETAPDLAVALRRLAGNEFTADWGARIISEKSPLFNPSGYHEGSVWPLFTGWAAAAEYATGRSVQAFTHVMQTALIKNSWAKGFVEEVMNGAVYEPSGVCAHQCWSETAILHPLIEGMIGWKPDAIIGSDGRPLSQLRPRFPMEWDTATVRNLRVGNTRMELTLSRTDTATTYTVRATERGGVAMEFAPEIPEGAHVLGVELSGFAVAGDFIRNHRGLLDPPLRFTGDAMIVVRHRGGAAMLAELPRPAPGDSSLGYRIVDDVRPAAAKSGFAYAVSLEGRAGTTHEFTLRTFGEPVSKMKGAKAFTQSGNRCTFSVSFPKSRERYSEAVVLFSIGAKRNIGVR